MTFNEYNCRYISEMLKDSIKIYEKNQNTFRFTSRYSNNLDSELLQSLNTVLKLKLLYNENNCNFIYQQEYDYNENDGKANIS
jgi:hypothetical protein